jgi:hypothetical protein
MATRELSVRPNATAESGAAHRAVESTKTPVVGRGCGTDRRRAGDEQCGARRRDGGEVA